MSTEVDIVERAKTKAAMITMGEKIAFGSDSGMILELVEELEKLRADRDAAARALTFYADPFAWKAAHDPGDDISVPDFYSETSFGDTAAEALSVIATLREGDAT